VRHANGCHWGRFVRTIVEVDTDNGIVGLGEMGGGGESAEAAFRTMKAYLVGHDPARIEEMRFLIANPNRVSLQQSYSDPGGAGVRMPRHSGAGLGRSGLRDPGRTPARRVRFAAYSFFRYPNPRTRRRRGQDQSTRWSNTWLAQAAVRIHNP